MFTLQEKNNKHSSGVAFFPAITLSATAKVSEERERILSNVGVFSTSHFISSLKLFNGQKTCEKVGKQKNTSVFSNP